MIERVSALRVRQNLGEVLNRVFFQQDEFVIERDGRPMAAMIPVEKLEVLERAARGQIAAILERRPKHEGMTPQAAERMADEAKHRARKRRDRTE
ncbi:MAG: type II toxin-antitoxin system Phd/YefM family antitoxin [Planctomycetes bacterium]|nr:type II toxin-antitoxin system Phd/YefM family antitoxin [Planctomycetota bacterium]